MTSEIKMLLGLGTVCAVIIGGVVIFSSESQNTVNEESQDILIRANSNNIEAKDSKVTLVEFGDYQCPACAAAHPTIKKLLTEYEGKITFVFRHFPLPQHTNAIVAAQAAEAAGEQKKILGNAQQAL